MLFDMFRSFYMAANEIFGEEESDQENDFEDFTTEALAEARGRLFRNQVEDDDDCLLMNTAQRMRIAPLKTRKQKTPL